MKNKYLKKIFLAYLKLYNDRALAEEEVDRIIKEVDQNYSGNVDFTGFCISIILIVIVSFFSSRICYGFNNEGKRVIKV